MGPDKLFKLQKLKIEAYYQKSRKAKSEIGTFEAMFNPETISQSYGIIYAKGQSINSSGKELNYGRTPPSTLNLKLLLDGTGVDRIGVLALAPPKTVADQVMHFLKLTYNMNGSEHQPLFLKVKWGGLKFDAYVKGGYFNCRLSKVDIKYTSFDRDGTPLRAELDVTLLSDEEVEKRMKKEKKKSPDLTHGRIVRNGDTLPLLTKEIYGNSEHYLRVAEINRLDDFRNLTPGQEIFFPPLES